MPCLQFLSLVFFLYTAVVSRAESNAAAWPKALTSRIASWKNVTSLTYEVSSSEISGTVVKRWKFQSLDGLLSLEEVMPTTRVPILKDSADIKKGGFIEWKSSSIDFSEPLRLDPFAWGAGSENDSFQIVEMSDERAILYFSEKKRNLILLPARDNLPDKRFAVGAQLLNGFNITPEGSRMIGDASLKALFNFDIQKFPGPRYYLNHAVESDVREVIVNFEFPDRYLSVLHYTLEEWNKAFGYGYYKFLGKTQIEIPDCLVTNRLCIQWRGGARFTWTGFHGTTEVVADPANGNVLGGIIYIYNDADESKAKEGSDTELALVENPTTLTEVLSGFSQLAKYSQIWRKDSTPLVKWLLHHEMGHFLGWTHNFAGAWEGTVENPGTTVMGYPPFNLAGKLQHLGSTDIANFQSLYQPSPPAPQTNFCGDLDLMAIANGKLWEKKIPECFMYSVGSAVDWLIGNAKIYGLWKQTYAGNVYRALAPSDPRMGTHLAALGFIIKADRDLKETQKAIRYLCEESPRDSNISPFLVQNIDVQLVCNP